MQLCYRGIRYQSNFARVLTIPGNVIGRYRGAVLRSQIPLMSTISQRAVVLRYRGVTYEAMINCAIPSEQANSSVAMHTRTTRTVSN
ncbi:DUF4278 domain-containing protein [Phormidesmis sp. 146-12]